VDDKTHESPVALDLLRHLILEGRIVTMDALLTQRQIAQHIVAARGDYVMVVKENQPQLWDDIETVFALPSIVASRLQKWIVSIRLGVMLLDFPGKHRLAQWLLCRPTVLHAIHRLRQRYGQPPLTVVCNHTSKVASTHHVNGAAAMTDAHSNASDAQRGSS
jgi:hypothetical protein